MDLKGPLNDPRRGDRSHADVEFLLGGTEIGQDRIKVGRFATVSLFRGLSEKIIEDGGPGPRHAGRRTGQQEAAPAQ